MITQPAPIKQYSRYCLPRTLILATVWDIARGRSRKIAADALWAVEGIRPEMVVTGQKNVPKKGPCLVVCNHYSRPGFSAWWIALGVTAAVCSARDADANCNIHWVMTADWTFPGSPWKRKFLTPITRVIFRRIANAYGFVNMPSMPPAPEEVHARAAAVLRTLRLARHAAHSGGMIGLAPEGRDTPGLLGEPPEGVGEFIALLIKTGLPVLPVGVEEVGGYFRVSCGEVFLPWIPNNRSDVDKAVANEVMVSIVRQLK